MILEPLSPICTLAGSGTEDGSHLPKGLEVIALDLCKPQDNKRKQLGKENLDRNGREDMQVCRQHMECGSVKTCTASNLQLASRLSII